MGYDKNQHLDELGYLSCYNTEDESKDLLHAALGGKGEGEVYIEMC